MSLHAYDLSAGLFIRGLSNLKVQLTKGEAHATASGGGEAALLAARLAHGGSGGGAPSDVHGYTLAGQAHWAAEGALLAIAHLLGAPRTPDRDEAKSFADLHRHLDGTIAHLRGLSAGDLEAGLERKVVIAHPRGSVSARGSQFLTAFALPHFYYHVSAAYSILRNEGVALTMGDFLGNWGAP